MSSKKDKEIEIVDENTGSSEITETFNSVLVVDDDDAQGVMNLLGPKSLRKPKDKKALLYLENVFSRETFLHKIQINSLPKSKEGFYIFGPYELSYLKKLAFDGELRKTDRVLFADDRWKPVLEEFPEWSVHIARHDELSRTAELTQTDVMDVSMMEGGEEATKSEDVDMGSHLELEDFGDELLRKTSQSSRPQAEKKPTKVVISKKLEIENIDDRKSSSRATNSKIEHQGTSFGTYVTLLALVGVGGFWFFQKNKEGLDKKNDTVVQSGAPVSDEIKGSSDWPVNLQPRSLTSLYQADSPIMKKIRPIMRSYEKGTTSFSPNDEMLLRRISDPASSSWEACKIASNQLAVHYLSRGDIARARSTLSPILREASDDFSTLVNMALIEISDAKLDQARDLLKVAFRVDRDMQWLSLTLLGMVEGLSDRWEDSDRNFRDALSRNPNNPFISGIWLQTLLKKGKGVRSQIQQLVEGALWADPDTFIDSPIPSPVAGHIFYSEAFDGLIRGAESLGAGLSASRLSFLRWFRGRVTSFNPLAQSSAQLIQELEWDDAVQAKVLLAYMYKESKRYDEAATLLTHNLPLIDDRQLTRSSWPWTLSGDVALARSRYDQAIPFYQSAINRNNNDHSAVHGLGITLRDRGQYQDAQQKIKEASSLQPYFLPAQLRMTRFEWQGLVRRE